MIFFKNIGIYMNLLIKILTMFNYVNNLMFLPKKL